MSLSLEHRRKTRRTLPNWSPLAPSHPNQILSFREWCALNHISERTGRRILASGEVVVTQLSPKRIGISVANNAKWQQSRERA